MEKELQRAINEQVDDIFICSIDELNSEYGEHWLFDAPYVRLRSCRAWVYESEHFYVLRSYLTIVAVIIKGTNTLFDAHYMTYDYSSIVAQHIRKFRADYGSYSAQIFTALPVSERTDSD